ncbi:MAG: long-chain fatty acid--CoA ligase, partial [Actinobacteria bacterium]
MIDAPADTGEDRVALIAGDRVRTYHDLDRRTNALARVLRDLGADPLERVAVLLPSDVELIETGLASAKAATVLVPVNWHLKRDEIAWI